MPKKKALTKKEKLPASLPSSYLQVLKNIKARIHAAYELIVKSLPKELKPSLPSIEQIEEELNKDLKA